MNNTGKKVKAHYVGTLDDGSVFDSSVERGEPIEFTCGVKQMIPGFDKAVEGMEVGEKKSVHIIASDAYGEYDPSMVQTISLAQLPHAEKLNVGDNVGLSGPGGQQIPAFVTEKTETSVTFDMNPPLAGKDLNFEITLVEVAE
jgi:FKBP-type peptidyl-prolyl cis-trans isomerase 2